jgi:hypothetical protein
MPVSETTIQTATASRYLQQLCKHFAHKIAVEYDSRSGRADFGFGVCLMTASDNALALHCEAETAEALGRVEYILNDHLRRFAWREKPEITWRAATP